MRAQDALTLVGADVAIQEGPNTEFPAPPQLAESVVSSGSPASKSNIPASAETGGGCVSGGGTGDFADPHFLQRGWSEAG